MLFFRIPFQGNLFSEDQTRHNRALTTVWLLNTCLPHLPSKQEWASLLFNIKRNESLGSFPSAFHYWNQAGAKMVVHSKIRVRSGGGFFSPFLLAAFRLKL